MPGKIAAEWMKAPARHVHILGLGSGVQLRQLSRQLRRMAWLDTRFSAVLEERLQPLMPE